MTIRGTLSPDQLGFSIPTGSPPYSETAARHYVDVDILRFDYLSDASAVAKLLPDVLEIDESPRAYLTFNRFGFSNAGCYLEVVQGLECYHKGEKAYFAVRMYMNSDTPMITGREWFGIPKLGGVVHFDPGQTSSLLSGRLASPWPAESCDPTSTWDPHPRRCDTTGDCASCRHRPRRNDRSGNSSATRWKPKAARSGAGSARPTSPVPRP